MYFKHFYLGCLSHSSYLIGSEGVAAVVDPQRDVDQYLEAAAEAGLTIRYVIETHLHADFVSGHQELAKRTGASILVGARSDATFPHVPVHDGEAFALGRLTLRMLETPGHTPEGISVLVIDPEQPSLPRMVLTGDTLFVGDVGRPDLVGAKGYLPEEMAGMLYDSLHDKLLKLPDEVEVFPAHGAGSACGRHLADDPSSTIGRERRQNAALQPMSRADFIRQVTTDLPAAPAYFSHDAEMNRHGAPSLTDLPKPRALGPAEIQAAMTFGSTVLDVRPADAYGAGHIPGAVNIGLDGKFANWVGSLLRADVPIVLVADGDAQIQEAVQRLARVGYERIPGFLDGGMARWQSEGLPVATVPQWSVEQLRAQLAANAALQVIDVRSPAEYGSGHVGVATSAPLPALSRHLQALDPHQPTAVICGSGYRSSAAIGLLETAGFEQLLNVSGGTGAWQEAGFPVTV